MHVICVYTYTYVCASKIRTAMHIIIINAYIHTYVRKYVHTYIHTYIHTYTYTHTYRIAGYFQRGNFSRIGLIQILE